MTAVLAEKRAFFEQHHKTPLKGELLPDDPARPDRKNIAFPSGKRAITLSVPKAFHNSEGTPFIYHHNGNEAEAKMPHISSTINTKTEKEEYIVDFEQGKARRDVEFTLRPGTDMTINLLGVNGRVRSSMIIKAGPDEEVVVSAEGQRNRWLTIKKGIAEEVHARGKDSGTDDDLRIVIGSEGFVRQLHLYDNSAAETPNVTRVGEFIGEMHVHGAAWLDNRRLRPGNTLEDMPGLVALGREGSRREVHPDTFHQGTALDRREYDDPKEYEAAVAAMREAEMRRIFIEPELVRRRNNALADEARYAEQVPPQVRRERRWPRFVSMLRRSSKDAEPSPAENHISLVTVDAHDRYLATIVMHAFHKAMIDYTDEDMRIALALAHVVTPTDQRPPAGRQATMVGEDGLRVIVGRDQHEAVRKAINTFMYGETNPSYKRIMHVSELAERKADGWDVIGEIDSILLQRAEEAAMQRELTAIKSSAATNVFIAPRHDAPPEVVPPARRRELAEAIA